MKIDLNQLRKLIINGDFSKAYLEINQLGIEEVYDFLIDLACDTKNIVVYGFVFYLISRKEIHIFHSLASDILAFPLCSLQRAYALALFHARRALELDPENIEHLQFLILFYDIPEKLIEESEALKIAKEILKRNPESNLAKETIARISKKRT